MIVFQHKELLQKALKEILFKWEKFKKKAIPPEASVDHMNMTRIYKYISTWRK